MEKRRLGTTDMDITRIGFGAWAIGGSWEFGWGTQDDSDSIAAIHRALDLGVNWIDTAAAYGLGHSEEVVARALKGRADRPYIFTKCSILWDDRGRTSHSLKAASVRRELEDSLRRLQVDVIDLYQIHWPDPDSEVEEGWRTLADLKAQGKVRYIGVSNFSVQQMRRAMSIAPIASLQPPYSLLRREIEAEILPFCAEHNIGVIVYSPMYSGLLTGKMTRERVANLPADDWRKRDEEFQEPRLRECNYGTLNGRPRDEVHAYGIDDRYPEGETWREAAERVGEFLTELTRTRAGERVLLIGHMSGWYALESVVKGLTLDEVFGTRMEWQEGWEYRLE